MHNSFCTNRSLFFASILFFFTISLHLHAGEGESFGFISRPNTQIRMGGYIKSEYFYDSRQVVAETIDQFLLYPKKKEFDPAHEDLNARGEGHFVAFESRLAFELSGTKVRCADLSGIIEGDFYGPSNIDGNRFLNDILVIPNLFRLRHAAIFLNWPNIQLTLGQYWHPLAIKECFPNTISFNNGSPMEPYSRAPQIQIDYEYCGFHSIACASYQLDFANTGPLGFNPVYQARSLVPNFDLKFTKNFEDHATGIVLDYFRIVPRIKTDECFAVVEPLSSFCVAGWLALNWPEKFAFHSKLSYCQNGTVYLVIGGFGTHSIDPCTDKREYTNINALMCWWDLIALPGKDVEPGLFLGVVKNLGASKSILPDCVDDCCNIVDQRTFGLGTDIDTVFRASPRIRWRLTNDLTIAAEMEYTRAAYGHITSSGKVNHTVPVGNFRGLCAAYYTF